MRVLAPGARARALAWTLLLYLGMKQGGQTMGNGATDQVIWSDEVSDWGCLLRAFAMGSVGILLAVILAAV